jgi:hypothetical protein
LAANNDVVTQVRPLTFPVVDCVMSWIFLEMKSSNHGAFPVVFLDEMSQVLFVFLQVRSRTSVRGKDVSGDSPEVTN